VRPVRRRHVGLKPFRNPAAFLGQRDVHELGADLAAINAPRVISNFPGKLKLGMRLGLEVPYGVKVRLEVAPTAEGIKH
jgi:hypothetical protein